MDFTDKQKPIFPRKHCVWKNKSKSRKRGFFFCSFLSPVNQFLLWHEDNKIKMMATVTGRIETWMDSVAFRSLESAEVVEVNTTVITATSKLSELDLRTQSRGEFTLGNEFTSKESQCGIHPNFPAMSQIWLIPNIPTIMSQWTHRFCSWTLSWPFSTNYLRIVRLFIEAWKKKGPVCADKGRLIFHSGPQVLKLIFINLVWTWNRSFQVIFFSVQCKRTESVVRRHNTAFIIIWFHLYFCAQLSGPSNWLAALW